MFLLMLPVATRAHAIPTDAIDVGAMVRSAAYDAGIAGELWRVQGYSSPAAWDRVLAGLAPLDLARLTRVHKTRAHITFWSILFGKLSSALIVRSFGQAVQDMHAIRDSIRAHEAKGQVRVWH